MKKHLFTAGCVLLPIVTAIFVFAVVDHTNRKEADAIRVSYQKIHQCRLDSVYRQGNREKFNYSGYCDRIAAVEETSMPEDFRQAFEKYRFAVLNFKNSGADEIHDIAAILTGHTANLKLNERMEAIASAGEQMRIVALKHDVQPPN